MSKKTSTEKHSENIKKMLEDYASENKIEISALYCVGSNGIVSIANYENCSKPFLVASYINFQSESYNRLIEFEKQQNQS